MNLLLQITLLLLTWFTSLANAIPVFSRVMASIDLAVDNKRFSGEMTEVEYNSDFYQSFKKVKTGGDIATGIVNLPQLATGVVKLTGKLVQGSLKVG